MTITRIRPTTWVRTERRDRAIAPSRGKRAQRRTAMPVAAAAPPIINFYCKICRVGNRMYKRKRRGLLPAVASAKPYGSEVDDVTNQEALRAGLVVGIGTCR